MATVTSASNAPAPTPAQLSQLPENTSSLSTTSKIQPLPQTNPATSGPSKTFSTSTGRTAISRTSPPKASISLPRSAIETLPITATASSRCRRRPPSTAVPRNTATSSNSSFQTVSLAQTLTPSFLTGQSATAKTTTARPTPSKQRSAKTPPKSHAPCWICRSTLTGTKLPPNSMISAQSLTTRRSSVTLIAASSQPLPTKTVTTSRSRPRRPNAGLHPLGRWRLLLGPSEGDRFGGDRRGVPSEELCGEASSSGGVRGDPLADRANERAIEKTAWQLEQFGSAKAAGYLRRWLPSIVTFAEHAVEGSRFRGPRTPSND